MPARAPDRFARSEGIHHVSSIARRGRVHVRGLLVPADGNHPCVIENLVLTAAALSDAIGGGLLEEGGHGQIDGAAFCMYLDEDRVAKRLRPNERAAVLSARLGVSGRSWLANLRGDVLVLGCDERLDDIDVPVAVEDTARQAGLLPGGA